MDRDSKGGIKITVFFYLVFAVAIIVTVNAKNNNLMDVLESCTMLIIFIILLEVASQRINLNLKKDYKSVLNLFFSRYLISLAMSLLSFFIVTYVLMLTLEDDKITKTIFNLMVSSSFLLTFIFYSIYQKNGVPELIKRIVTKFNKEETFDKSNLVIEIYKEKIVNEKVAKYIDLLTIFATVFLLSNSTFTTLNPAEIDLKASPYNSLEFSVLIYVIPIYVQSAFYRLTL